MHRRMNSFCRTFQRHWVCTARGSFKFKADKSRYKHLKPIRSTAGKHLPDSLESHWTFQRFIEKLTRYFRSGFIEYVRGNYEGYHSVFAFTHQARCKSTERPDVPCWICQVSDQRVRRLWSFSPQNMWGVSRKWEKFVDDIGIHFKSKYSCSVVCSNTCMFYTWLHQEEPRLKICR